MEWIYNIPEPFRAIIATIIAVVGFLLIFGSPLLILTLGTCAILDSDSNKDKEEYGQMKGNSNGY